MDPLSVAASILTIIGAGGAVGRGLRKLASLRHAPEVISELQDERAELKTILEEVPHLLHHYHIATSKPPSIVIGPLNRLKKTVLDLEHLLCDDLLKAKDGEQDAKFSRLKWFTCQRRLMTLRASIQRHKAELLLALSPVNMSLPVFPMIMPLSDIILQIACFRASSTSKDSLKLARCPGSKVSH